VRRLVVVTLVMVMLVALGCVSFGMASKPASNGDTLIAAQMKADAAAQAAQSAQAALASAQAQLATAQKQVTADSAQLLAQQTQIENDATEIADMKAQLPSAGFFARLWRLIRDTLLFVVVLAVGAVLGILFLAVAQSVDPAIDAAIAKEDAGVVAYLVKAVTWVLTKVGGKKSPTQPPVVPVGFTPPKSG